MAKIKCTDKKCPHHGNVSLRGRTIMGTVVSKDVHRTAIIEYIRTKSVPKFERYEKKKKRLSVHNPPCIDADIGDKVRAGECRPLSKSKKFVIFEKIGEDMLFKQKKEGIEESKVKKEKVEENAADQSKDS